MSKPQLWILILLLILPVRISAQEAGYGTGYHLTMVSNPAITGSEGDGYLRLSYMNFYPGNTFNLHSASLSYDGYFPSLHGGAGIFISNNYLGGIVNDLRGGFSYAYFFQAGRDLYFSSGLSASFYHRGYSFSGAVLPDQIDPLMGSVLPPGEILTSQGRTVFDLGTGFMFFTGKFFGGISVNHLAKPDLSESDFSDSRLKRSLFIHLTGDFNINREKSLEIRSLGMLSIEKGYISGAAGAVFKVSHLAVNLLLYGDNEKNIDAQAGFTVNAGTMILYYNYRFNIFAGENLLPFSLLHHTGIAIRLNNVDKRKAVKTINFPKL